MWVAVKWWFYTFYSLTVEFCWYSSGLPKSTQRACIIDQLGIPFLHRRWYKYIYCMYLCKLYLTSREKHVSTEILNFTLWNWKNWIHYILLNSKYTQKWYFGSRWPFLAILLLFLSLFITFSEVLEMQKPILKWGL